MTASPQARTNTENVDPSEIAKFSELAHRWWDIEAEFKPLHAINPIRLRWIEQMTGLLDSRQVLDVGCGGGILADSMARTGAVVLGIDLSSKALKVAQLHAIEAETPCIQYREISAEALADEQAARFDVVTCMEMLEHVPDPGSVVAACSRLVKPGGWVVFSTINRNLKSWLMGIVAAEYILKMVPKGTHEYAKLITPADLTQACRDNGLHIRGATGLHHNPITGRFWLAPDASVNYMLATQKSH